MTAEEYAENMRYARVELDKKIKFNYGDQVELETISQFLQLHMDTLDDIGMTHEYQSIVNRIGLFQETLTREGKCLVDMNSIFEKSIPGRLTNEDFLQM